MKQILFDVTVKIKPLPKNDMTDEQLYEATRGVWKIGIDRENAKYALSVANGIVHEVYQIGAWQPAGSAAYNTRPKKDVSIPGRWEFTGKVAPDAVRGKYVDRSVADYFKPGNAAPVNYVNIKSRDQSADKQMPFALKPPNAETRVAIAEADEIGRTHRARFETDAREME